MNGRLRRAELAVLPAALVIVCVASVGLALPRAVSTRQLLRESVAATEKLGTYRFVIHQRFSRANQPAREEVGLRGVVDLDADAFRFVRDIEALGVKASCVYLYLGDSFFVNVDRSRQSTLGAEWLRTTVDSPLEQSISVGLTPREFDANLVELFSALRPAGSEHVDGVATTKFAGTVRHAVFGGEDVVDPDAPYPVELFIDADKLVRRVVATFKTAGLSNRFTTDRYDFGEPAEISRPRPSSIKPAQAATFKDACFPTDFPGR
jgi:hypothetical protein